MKENKKLDLSIVIISSKKDFLVDCVRSIKDKTSNLSYEIIIVDNASADKVGKLAKLKFPEVKIIRREKNGGFGENNNMGMKVARGRYVLLLNDDTKIIQKNTFQEMVDWMDKHPKVGLSSCGLLNEDKKTLQGSGGYFPTLFRVFAWMSFLDDIPVIDRLIKPYHPLHGWSPFYKGEKFFEETHKQDWVTGAYYLMRKEAMDEAGLFDEDFFLYVEEVELSYRFHLKGWETWYLPKWKIIHYGQVTTGSENAMVMELTNLVLFYKKHHPKWKIPILRILLKFGVFIRIFVFGILQGPKVSKIYVKAFKQI